MADDRHECQSCHVVFSNPMALTGHRLTCAAKPITLSFYGVWNGASGASKDSTAAAESIGVEQTEKILPLSQPLYEVVSATADKSENEQQTFSCGGCQRSFKSAKGLKKHKHSCKGPAVVVETASNQTSISIEANTKETDPTPDQTSSSSDEPGQQPAALKIWGIHSIVELNKIVDSMYDEVVFWRKNLFKVPSGAAGKKLIREMTRLIEVWSALDDLANVSLKMLMVLPGIMLQKPTRKSTSKQHSEYLTKRLTLWLDGNFEELLKEGRQIQKKLKQNERKDETPEKIAKNFAKLMLQGKVHAALRILDKQESLGVATLNEETIKTLKNLHPNAKSATEEVLMSGELPYCDPVVFTNIDESSIAKAAMRTRGAAGPSGLDADGWRRILISKNFGEAGKDLRTALANMSKILCTKEIVFPENNQIKLEAYIACRLIPLNKKPSGIRPIGIGEVLRRIIGKAVIAEIKPDLMESAGSLQLCAGQKSGCEAAAHAMREIYEEEETDAVLMIDASNAFNCLNREALLHYVRYLCPLLATYVRNCYKVPSRLFVAGGVEISSAEGTTQGDPSAMPSYAIGILPLLAAIKPTIDPELTKHVAYADDLAGGSKLERLREWWDRTVQYGPAFGYYPKSSKSWLIVKESEFERAQEVFQGTGINITTSGQKYLGGFVGTVEAIREYVQALVDDWMEQLEVLTSIAKTEPQAAYSAFTSGFKHKLTYYIRTIPNISDIIKPLDDLVNSEFIPAITEGHKCNRLERTLLSLPVKLGGMGIPIFSDLCDIEFNNS